MMWSGAVEARDDEDRRHAFCAAAVERGVVEGVERSACT
jgi:hypothetical protein